MAEFGLRIKNGASEALIDSNTQQISPFFDSVVSVPNRPSSRPFDWAPLRKVTIPFAGRQNMPFVFMQGQSNLYLSAPRCTYSGGLVTSISTYAETTPITASGVTSRVVLADSLGQLNRSPDSWGLRVWGPSGEDVYDSRDGVLTIIDAVSFNLPPPHTISYDVPSVSVSHAPSDNAFYLISNVSAAAVRLYGTNLDLYIPGTRKINSASVEIKWVQSEWMQTNYSAYVSTGHAAASTLLVAELDYSF